MSNKIYNLAFDLGASSGRLILSEFDGEKITLKELRRFPNEPVKMNGVLYWDIFRMFGEMKEGLKAAAKQTLDGEIKGIGIDAWGVDYLLLDGDGNIAGLPIAYRDERTRNLAAFAAEIVPANEIYGSTGIQFMDFNTLYQWIADKKTRGEAYKNAKYYLSIPDFLNFCLTGKMCNEYTHATTTQAISANSRDWDYNLLDKLGLRHDLFCEMVFPGTKICCLTGDIQAETGLGAIPVYAVGSHDTASAVAGTPFSETGKDKTFLSCGTWSLLGMELDDPLITPKTFDCNFTNEGGVYNKIRFLKNINGLWIIQRLRKNYNENNSVNVSFSEIAAAARENYDKGFIINPSDESFTAPLDMSAAIASYCVRDGQGKPETLGELASAVYKGLTREYASNVTVLSELTGSEISVIHMIGGGIQDSFLCEQTAKATSRTVITGPVEGSVLGNVITQLIAGEYIADLQTGRRIIGSSFELKEYLPD